MTHTPTHQRRQSVVWTFAISTCIAQFSVTRFSGETKCVLLNRQLARAIHKLTSWVGSTRRRHFNQKYKEEKKIKKKNSRKYSTTRNMGNSWCTFISPSSGNAINTQTHTPPYHREYTLRLLYLYKVHNHTSTLHRRQTLHSNTHTNGMHMHMCLLPYCYCFWLEMDEMRANASHRIGILPFCICT